MKLAFKVTVKKGPKVVAEFVGDAKDAADLTIGDVVEKVLETEMFLEKLTGHRIHIEQVL